MHAYREDNKILYYSLVASLSIHTAIIGILSMKQFNILKRKVTQVEVTYQKPEKKQEPVKPKDLSIIKEIKPPEPAVEKFMPKEEKTLSFDRKITDLSKLPVRLDAGKKQGPPIMPSGKERQIAIPMLKSEKITNPAYIGFRNALEARVRKLARLYIDRLSNFEPGEVYLTFIVTSAGQIKDVHIIDSKSSANEALKNIAVRSLRESGPYAFPEEYADYPELTFNVIIAFTE